MTPDDRPTREKLQSAWRAVYAPFVCPFLWLWWKFDQWKESQ